MDFGPQLETAYALWSQCVAAFSAKPCFRHKAGGQWVTRTYAEVNRDALAVAAGLVAVGMKPGDRFCIASQTRPEWMDCDLAGVLAGLVSVPVYPSLLPEHCHFIAKNAGVRLVVAEDAAQLDKFLPLAIENPDLTIVCIGGDAHLDRPDHKGRTRISLDEVLDGAAGARERILTWAELTKKGAALLADGEKRAALEGAGAGVTPESVFTIVYTSGTTGMPKGVVISHRALASAIQSAVRALTLLPEDNQYLFLPLAHILGRELAWAPLIKGGVSTFSEGMSKIKENLVEVRPTFMAGVPRVFEKFFAGVSNGMAASTGIKKVLVNWALGVGQRHSKSLREGGPGAGLSYAIADKLVFSKIRAKLGLDRCRFLISGGAPLAAEIGEFFHGAGLLILEGYGLTETMAAAFLNRLDSYRFGTVGPALDIVEFQRADDGEILLKGPSIFRSYHDNPDATAEAIDAQGWFHTGDIGHLEDGFLRITDRKKDIIILAAGKNVAPQPIENKIKAQCTDIGQVVVFGDKKPYCVALITLSEEALGRFSGDGDAAVNDPTLKAAIDGAVKRVNEGLASFETIKRFALLPREFTEATGELTPSMKVKRKVVLKAYADKLEALYH